MNLTSNVIQYLNKLHRDMYNVTLSFITSSKIWQNRIHTIKILRKTRFWSHLGAKWGSKWSQVFEMPIYPAATNQFRSIWYNLCGSMKTIRDDYCWHVNQFNFSTEFDHDYTQRCSNVSLWYRQTKYWLQNNTARCRYNAVNFLKTFPNDTP